MIWKEEDFTPHLRTTQPRGRCLLPLSLQTKPRPATVLFHGLPDPAAPVPLPVMPQVGWLLQSH